MVLSGSMVQVCPAPALQSEITTGAPLLAEFPMVVDVLRLVVPGDDRPGAFQCAGGVIAITDRARLRLLVIAWLRNVTTCRSTCTGTTPVRYGRVARAQVDDTDLRLSDRPGQAGAGEWARLPRHRPRQDARLTDIDKAP